MTKEEAQRLVVISYREKSGGKISQTFRTYLHERRRALITELRAIEKVIGTGQKDIDKG